RTQLLPSLPLTAQVGVGGSEQKGYGAVIDYNLTARFASLTELPPPVASILTNENDDATHTLVIKGGDGEPLRLFLTEGQMGGAIDAARAQLRATHFKEFEKKVGVKRERENLLDAENAKPRDQFITDLVALAPLGWKLLNALLAGQKDWWKRRGRELFKNPGTILVGRKKRSQFVFPWALVYDLPLDTGTPATFQPCPVLATWPPTVPAGQPFPTRCPRETEHASLNTICPFGF